MGAGFYLKNNGILTRCTDMYRDERFRELGLNSRQSVLLLQVCRNPGVTQDALSKAILIDKSNITRQMGVLEEAGLKPGRDVMLSVARRDGHGELFVLGEGDEAHAVG